MRRYLIALVVLVAACSDGRPADTANTVVPAGPGTPDPTGRTFDTPPRFDDYPAAGPFRGRPAEPDLSSHPDAARFSDALRTGAQRGPDFAGRYTIVSRSCGRLCREFVIVDAISGRVFSGLSDTPPFTYRLDSKLIAFEAPAPLPGRVPCAGCSAAYYVWDDERLGLIPPELWVGSAPPPASVASLIDSLRASEKPFLARVGPAVVRATWDRLVIAARDGSRQVLGDRLHGDAIVRVFVFRGHDAALDHYLIESVLFEGGGYVVVDAETGRVTELDAAPVASPDGERFITTSADLVAGHNPNRIRIYRRSPAGPEIEWSLEPRDWGGADARWLDGSTIALDRVTVDWNVRPLELLRSPIRLELTEEGWKMAR